VRRELRAVMVENLALESNPTVCMRQSEPGSYRHQELPALAGDTHSFRKQLPYPQPDMARCVASMLENRPSVLCVKQHGLHGDENVSLDIVRMLVMERRESSGCD